VNPSQTVINVSADVNSQTERLRGVKKDVNDIEITLKTASKQISSIARNVSGDKFCIVAIVLISIGLILITITKIVKRNNSTNPPPTGDVFQF
jgi:hypothetical protein